MTINVKRITQKYGILFILIVMSLVFAILSPAFLSIPNILNILNQTAIWGIMALGMTFVIVAKGIDLSVGSVLAFSGLIAASLAQVPAQMKLYQNLPQLPLIIPILAGLLIGALCGAVNGALIAFTRIPAFIATLGMMTVVRGFALIYSNARPVSNLTPAMNAIGSRVFGIPVPILIYLFMFIVSYILLNKTRFGKNTFAIGGNITAAEVSGVNVPKNLVLIYAYCGLLAGIAAIVFAGRVGSVHPGAADGYELTAIAATTIGGTSHSGGIGTIGGALIGALVLSVMRNGMTLLGFSPYSQKILEGVIIVGAVVIDMRKNARKA
ncbi:ABC transporter permease [Treponema primitia]|uniref:ABC transporter permease n=1 Tax=Treponema primitia TaxID=88058 RepID=UPI0002554EFE|nr:ABC transporter permease [Treponema primitia]